MPDTIEYRAWNYLSADLLGMTDQSDDRDGYHAGMAFARDLIAKAEAELSAEDLEFGSPFSIQICRDDTDITATYGIGWE